MSSPDSSYIDRLAAAVRKLAGVHCVGETWISFDGSIPTGGVPFTGQLVSRALYANLWAWVQANKTVVTDAQWQATASAQNGMCASYSSGDGSTTFRVPNVVGGYFCGGDTSTAGGYTQAGLPNITGTWAGVYNSLLLSGAVSGNFTTDFANNVTGSAPVVEDRRAGFNIDASRSNPVYGRSNTVTPETFRVMVGVYAIGSSGNIGSPEAQAALSAIATLESNRADTSLSNLTVAGKAVGAGLGMPSGRYEEMALGASMSTYTAPATGYFYYLSSGPNTANYPWARMENVTLGMNYISLGYADIAIALVCPVHEGEVVLVQYGNEATAQGVTFRFYYTGGTE